VRPGDIEVWRKALGTIIFAGKAVAGYTLAVKDKQLASMANHKRMPRRARPYHRADWDVSQPPSDGPGKSARKNQTRPGSKRVDEATFGGERFFGSSENMLGTQKQQKGIPEADGDVHRRCDWRVRYLGR
jgi:hypothetical protein